MVGCEPLQLGLALTAQERLARSGLVVEAGVDDAAVVARLVQSYRPVPSPGAPAAAGAGARAGAGRSPGRRCRRRRSRRRSARSSRDHAPARHGLRPQFDGVGVAEVEVPLRRRIRDALVAGRANQAEVAAPVAQPGPADHAGSGDRAEDPRVLRRGAVVAQDEELVLGTAQLVCSVQGVVGWPGKTYGSFSLTPLTQTAPSWTSHRVAGNADHALDEGDVLAVLLVTRRRLEDDDVAALVVAPVRARACPPARTRTG